MDDLARTAQLRALHTYLKKALKEKYSHIAAVHLANAEIAGLSSGVHGLEAGLSALPSVSMPSMPMLTNDMSMFSAATAASKAPVVVSRQQQPRIKNVTMPRQSPQADSPPVVSRQSSQPNYSPLTIARQSSQPNYSPLTIARQSPQPNYSPQAVTQAQKLDYKRNMNRLLHAARNPNSGEFQQLHDDIKQKYGAHDKVEERLRRAHDLHQNMLKLKDKSLSGNEHAKHVQAMLNKHRHDDAVKALIKQHAENHKAQHEQIQIRRVPNGIPKKTQYQRDLEKAQNKSLSRQNHAKHVADMEKKYAHDAEKMAKIQKAREEHKAHHDARGKNLQAAFNKTKSKNDHAKHIAEMKKKYAKNEKMMEKIKLAEQKHKEHQNKAQVKKGDEQQRHQQHDVQKHAQQQAKKGNKQQQHQQHDAKKLDVAAQHKKAEAAKHNAAHARAKEQRMAKMAKTTANHQAHAQAKKLADAKHKKAEAAKHNAAHAKAVQARKQQKAQKAAKAAQHKAAHGPKGMSGSKLLKQQPKQKPQKPPKGMSGSKLPPRKK